MGLLLYGLLINLLLAVFILSYGLLLRRSGWFAGKRVLLWLLVLLAGWLPVADLPTVDIGVAQTLVQRAETLLPTVIRTNHVLHYPTDQQAPASRIMEQQVDYLGSAPIPTQTLLLWLYGLGVLLMTGRLGGQFVALRRLIREPAQPKIDGLRVVENPAVASPFSFFHYVVLNPALYPPDVLSQVLRHEGIHSRCRHSVDRLLSEVLRIVLWMNPFVWWHGRLVEENLEYQVDRAVVQAGVDARLYHYNLLAVSLLTNAVCLTNSFSRLPLSSRIRMMNRPQSVRTGVVTALLFGVIIGFLLVTWSAAQQELVDERLSPFAMARGNQTYFVLLPTATALDLRTMQATALRRHITLEIAPAVLRDGRHRIRQISFGVRPATPAQARWTSLKAGTPYGDQPIGPLGIRCDPTACTVLPVDQTFPVSLRELAQRESGTPTIANLTSTADRVSKANVRYGLYETYFLDDMIEGSFYGLRAMLLRIRPDKHLDLYDDAKNAVIIWDKHEIARADLNRIRVTEVMKLSVYKGDAAVARLGDERARPGLVVLSRHPNPAQADAYAASRYLYR